MEANQTITKEEISEIEKPTIGQPSRKLAVFGLIGLFVVFAASVLFRPPAGDYFSVCGFKNVTGLPCPGCGLTHSFCALGKGEVTDAFGFNLLGPLLFVVLILLWLRSACVLLGKSGAVQLLDRLAGRFNVARAFVAAFAVYGIIRIGYVIAYQPGAFRNSPLSHLIDRLTH